MWRLQFGQLPFFHKIVLALALTVQDLLTCHSLGLECLPRKVVMTLIVLDKSSFPHQTSKELWNLNRRVYTAIPGRDRPVLQIDFYLIKLLHLLRDSGNL